VRRSGQRPVEGREIVSAAYVWDPSAVAALDAVENRYARHGAHVEITGEVIIDLSAAHDARAADRPRPDPRLRRLLRGRRQQPCATRRSSLRHPGPGPREPRPN
jgi:hypothetical protein